MHLRPLHKRDIPTALKLIKENYPHHPLFVRRARHELGAMFQKGVVVPHYVAAIEDGQLVGFAGSSQSWMDYDIHTLFWVNVEPHDQGKGIGTKMVKMLMKGARHRGAKYLLFSTTKPAFYRRLGFRQIAKFRYHYVLMLGAV